MSDVPQAGSDGADPAGAGPSGSTPPVYLVPSVPSGDTLVLDGEEAHHAVTVRRTRVGERLVISDGEGGLADCVVTGVHPGRRPSLELDVEETRIEPPPALRVRLAQALVKGDRGELAVELATEAGVDGILPWRASRSVARWDDGPRGAKALARWRAAVRAAAKQARRGRVPHVTDPVSTRELVDVVAGADRALVLDGGADATLPEVTLPTRGELVVVVGPEGGLTADEQAAFAEAGADRVRLGGTVLRASTAGTVALGALGALTGRWR